MGQRRVASPVTATTDLLAPDIVNMCGRAFPAGPSKGPGRRMRRVRHPSTVRSRVKRTSPRCLGHVARWRIGAQYRWWRVAFLSHPPSRTDG